MEETSTPRSLPGRVKASILRDPLTPRDDRGRMRMVMNNLILHIHPPRVSAGALKLSYTFGLGGLLILLFAVLAATGVLLLFTYTPSPEAAYKSIIDLQTRVEFGALIRNLHHWAGNLMIVAGVLHLLRVFFTHGFARPREFNWTMGLAMLLLIVGANFTGYLLPWHQLAYWAVTVGTSLLDYIPVVGPALTRLLLGGAEVGAPTLTNFYALHVAVIPLSLFAIASFHIFRVRKDTITVPHRQGAETSEAKVTTIPHLVRVELAYALVWIALLIGWSAFVNAPLEQAANPAQSPNPAKAAWYFMGFQELLLHFHPVFSAIIIPGLGLFGLLAIPYLDQDMQTPGVWFRSRRGLILAGAGFMLGVLAAAGFVFLDEYWLDLAGWMSFLPASISNGYIPFAVLVLLLIGYHDGLRTAFGATRCEARQSVFTLLLGAFVALSLVGIFFRGAGMALTLPWS